MARDLTGKEIGFNLFGVNADNPGAAVLVGSTVPGGDTSYQDDAPVPSLYFRSGTDEVYKKILSNNNTGDWELVSSSNLLAGFRNEKVIVATNDTVAIGVRDMAVSPFADDEGTQLGAADFAVGEYVIADADGTPVLLEITDITGDDVTFAAASQALADNDSFVVRNYLPDTPDNQEQQALVVYNGSSIIKLADVNWNFADGIGLNGFTPQTGAITGADSVQTALEKLQFQLNSFSGTNDGSSTGITTATDIDSVLVDEVAQVEYDLIVELVSDPSRKRKMTVEGFHNGHAGADATQAKDQIVDRQKIGASFNAGVSVIVFGVGAAQEMRLRVQASSAVNVYWRREDVKF